MASGPIKVLIVDDSPLVRSILTRVLTDDGGIEIVGGAKDPYEAREMIIAYRPDVIILDIEMPRMDGVTFLKKLMAHYPVPVIMCSGAAPANSRLALQSIECGAIDVVAKPSSGGRDALKQLGGDLAEKVRGAFVAVRRSPPRIPVSAKREITPFSSTGLDPSRHLIVLGASTGGTEATRELLSNTPADFPPIAIVQHMPEGFTRSYAGRLDEFSPMSVAEAQDGDVLLPGKAFVARGGVQMMIRNEGGRLKLRQGTDELVNRHCPSVDVLFNSAAQISGRILVGILLTGMGADGARGMLELHQKGALTIAQDAASCVVYGMPKVAVELGGVDKSAPPTKIPGLVMQMLARNARSKSNSKASAGAALT